MGSTLLGYLPRCNGLNLTPLVLKSVHQQERGADWCNLGALWWSLVQIGAAWWNLMQIDAVWWNSVQIGVTWVPFGAD